MLKVLTTEILSVKPLPLSSRTSLQDLWMLEQNKSIHFIKKI